MYKYSKLSLKIFLLTLPVLWLYVIISVYIYDPLQVWHKPFFREVTYSENARESMPAIIRDFDFDSAIIGNSYSENTSASEASQKLGGKFMNLSVTGATTYENKMLIEYLLKHKKIEQFVYFLETSYLTQVTENESYPLSQYAFLYDNNRFNDFKIYMNFKYLQATLLFSKNKNYIGIERDMDAPYSWYEDNKKFFGGFQNWMENKDHFRIKEIIEVLAKAGDTIKTSELPNEEKTKITEFFNKNLMPSVINNPDIMFYLILPPISDMWLSVQLHNENMFFEKRNFALEHLALLSTEYKNLKVFAFDDLDIIGKTEDFKDLAHYGPWVNSYILTSIQENKNIITPENIGGYISKLYEKSVSFDLKKYSDIARAAVSGKEI